MIRVIRSAIAQDSQHASILRLRRDTAWRWCVYAAVLCGLSSVATACTPIKVFLMSGQSNMRETAFDAAQVLRKQQNVLLSYSCRGARGTGEFRRDEWGPLDQLPPNSKAGQVIGRTYGPELTAGRVLADRLGATPGAPIAIVKVAQDGSRVVGTHDSWRVSSLARNDSVLSQLYRQTRAALGNSIDGQAATYEIACMFWMQGESDTNPLERSSAEEFQE